MGCAAPHPFHWQDLRNKPSEEVLGREGVRLASGGHAYELRFLNAVYHVDPVEERIAEIAPDPSRVLTQEFQILLLQYLAADNGGPMDDRDVSEKDFPGGVTFFQGPHALYVAPIVELYGSEPEAFAARCSELGAHPAVYGDKSMRFYPFPTIPVTYVLWRADDEFPASVSILFDQSITRWFEFDMVFTLVWVLTERIVEGQLRPRKG